MPSAPGTISHVSDTARWVAIYRAMESERPDALFHDPYARALAGVQGEAIVDTIPRGRQMAWAMIVRTQVFDEVILEKVRTGGVDLVLNIAAGLDARPWRLDLPRTLRWVDVDFPHMVAHKSAHMAGVAPRCDYRAVAADLADAGTRTTVLADATAGARCVLVVAEGLLIYLTADQVAALAADLAAMPSARWWLIDLASPRLLEWMQKSWGKRMSTDTTSQFKFAPETGTAFFNAAGWREERWISSMDAAERLKRTMRGVWFWKLIAMFYPKRVREGFKRFSGYALLERTR
ncbi:MAG TPA: class I SAM-dependent methyltransferase [Gemmatimonadaceae bacterium]|nr:class I SAM-dependent methyltransferase [Gemmatimonadaceae bacterium]